MNPRNFKNYRRDDIIVSLAGIVTNLIVALITTIVFYFSLRGTLGSNEAFYSIVLNIITINLSLAVFNLLPIYPLDGSHVFESLFMRKIPKFFMFMRNYGQYILIALLVFGVISSVLGYVVNALFRLFSWIALALVGLF